MTACVTPRRGATSPALDRTVNLDPDELGSVLCHIVVQQPHDAPLGLAASS